MTENPIVVVDDNNGDPTDRPNHTSYHVTVDNPCVGGENTDGDAGAAAHVGEVVANPDLGDATMLQCDNRLAIATSLFTSPEIPESDSKATLDEERQLHPSVQGDSIASPSGKRSRSRSRSDRINGRGSHWVFDVFAEDDGGTAEDGPPVSKRARSSPRPLEATETRPPPAAAVVVKGVQMPSSAHGDQEYEVHQIIGESGLGMKSPPSRRSAYPRHRWILSWRGNTAQNRERPLGSGPAGRRGCKIRIERDGSMVGGSSSGTG